MSRHRSAWAVAFIASCIVAGCAMNKVSFDLVNYVNQGILGIAELETRALASYASVTGTNYTSDERVHAALKDEVIPSYAQFYDLLKEIRPETEEVKELHLIYVRGAENILSGFRMKMLGLEKKDVHVIREGNRRIEQGRKETEKWREELQLLSKKQGISQEKKGE